MIQQNQLIGEDVNKASNLFFYVAFAIKLFQWNLSITVIPWQLNGTICDWVCVALLIVSIIVKKGYSIPTFLFFVVLAINSLVLVSTANDKEPLLLCLFIIAAYKSDFKVVLVSALSIHLLFLIVCTFCSLTGLLPNYQYIEPRGMRYSLGYTTYNFAPREFFYCIMYYSILNKKKINVMTLVLMEIGTLFYTHYTLSRTTFYLTTVFIVAILLSKFFKDQLFNSKFFAAFTWIFVILGLISIVATNVYSSNPNKYAVLNDISTHRLYLMANAASRYGYHLFGTPIEWIGIDAIGYRHTQYEAMYNYVDNSYLNVLLNYGIIYFIIALAILTIIYAYSFKNKNELLTIVLVILAIRSVIESNLWSMQYNVFILLLGPAIDSLFLSRQTGHKQPTKI